MSGTRHLRRWVWFLGESQLADISALARGQDICSLLSRRESYVEPCEERRALLGLVGRVDEAVGIVTP